MTLYLELAAGRKTAPVVDDDNKEDENEDAAESGRNCNLGEIPKRNNDN